jgi:quercetin dioxygenase-like cupin family protein
MYVYNKNKLTPKEIVPGFFGRFIHSENITTAFWEIKKGSELPEHDHIFEQITQVIEGEFEMFIGGKQYLLKTGDVAVIPGYIVHSGKALSDCKLIDTFYPVRKEYS